MYSDSMKLSNKIITSEDLVDIFSLMNEKLSYYKKINSNDMTKNSTLDYKYQTWAFKDIDSKLEFNVEFDNGTQIKFEKYDSFFSIFNDRLDEIKTIYVYFSLNYSTKEEEKEFEYYHQHITMWIYKNKMDTSFSISETDKKIQDVYELIKNKIINAPERYDEVVKGKSKISMTVTFAIGLIPALVIATLLLLVPEVKDIYAKGYVVYPIVCIMIALVVGGTASSYMLDKYYKKISPDKKYDHYDMNKNKSVYKDDIDSYIDSNEILIGTNANNMECRKKIKSIYETYKGIVPIELGIIILLSIIVIFI